MGLNPWDVLWTRTVWCRGEKVKHLALCLDEKERNDYGIREHEVYVCDVIKDFSNFHSFALAWKRHIYFGESTDCRSLEFMDSVELLVWQNFRGRIDFGANDEPIGRNYMGDIDMAVLVDVIVE